MKIDFHKYFSIFYQMHLNSHLKMVVLHWKYVKPMNKITYKKLFHSNNKL